MDSKFQPHLDFATEYMGKGIDSFGTDPTVNTEILLERIKETRKNINRLVGMVARSSLGAVYEGLGSAVFDDVATFSLGGRIISYVNYLETTLVELQIACEEFLDEYHKNQVTAKQ